MRYGFRIPSFKKRFAASTSLKRIFRHSLGFKAPRGLGIVTNPKRAAKNLVYRNTSIGVEDVARALIPKPGKIFFKKPYPKRRKSKSAPVPTAGESIGGFFLGILFLFGILCLLLSLLGLK